MTNEFARSLRIGLHINDLLPEEEKKREIYVGVFDTDVSKAKKTQTRKTETFSTQYHMKLEIGKDTSYRMKAQGQKIDLCNGGEEKNSEIEKVD